MPKRKIFISYSSADLDRVKILEELINKSKLFIPIIIADQRQALIPLAQKVIDGIKNSDIIVPILTTESIKGQWINQEIGFATSEEKKIMPIVQKEIIHRLKGFIHKEIDLPYSFSKGTKLLITNDSFIKACEVLLNDLETAYELPINDKKDLSLEKAIRIKRERDLMNKKQELINSPMTVNQFRQIVFDEIIEGAKQKISNIQQEVDFHFKVEIKKAPELAIIFGAEGYSASIHWTQKSTNSVEGSFLNVVFWEGMMVFKFNNLPPSEQRKIIERGTNKYYSTINDDLLPIWKNNRLFSSGEIIDSAIDWILRSIEKDFKK